MANEELDIEAELARFEAEQRAALGLETEAGEHWRDEMVDPFFSARQKPHTTILVGGLTMAHDFLVEGGLRGLGYHVRALECPDTHALRFGKEFGNRGQCNPTYFTVGNLVKELCRLRDEEGLSADHIIEHYVFLTAGACGPCRFGMYVTEYRKALRDAGFDGFRVLLFQQTGGLKQASGEELGLKLDPKFFVTIGQCLFAGDIINLIGYRLRPYEVVEGAADRAVAAAKQEIYDALAARSSILAAIWRARQHFAKVEVDRLQAKPSVAVLGEFWAMTTEGDGNYHLQRFLETEGAEVGIQVIANLLLYNLWEFRHDTKARMHLRGADGGNFGLQDADVGLTLAGLFLGEIALRVWWQSWAHLMGLHGHHLPDMDEVAEAGHSYYNQELRGGEGHMEVAKLILNVIHQKAHMTLSVKPFGCMPSSGVSDGVQSVITERFPEAIFCAVETSGDGAVNFYSRVQMFLFKARQRALAEFQAALDEHGVTVEQLREVAAGTHWASPFYRAPHRTAGSGADLVHHLAPLVGAGPLERARIHATRTAKSMRKHFTKDVPKAWGKVREVAPYLPALARYVGLEAKDFLPVVTEGLTRMVEGVVKPTDEEQRAIDRAAEAPTPRVDASPAPTASLPVMA
ncbi:MAG TPA: 2-hydroxyglutaryl-CoA dehydratase [Sandaracinaceae bacterium LLY-WYZ-13_1]|nr:2-hydroxyglutaryl-CoA dehydratase [Sandaracinaceae bacterium LLY-WYZ-13_1]